MALTRTRARRGRTPRSNAARRAKTARAPRAAELLFLKVIGKRMDLFNAAVEEILFPSLEDVALKEERFITSERQDAIPRFIQRRLEGIELRIAQIFDEEEMSKELSTIGKRVSNKAGQELQRVAGIDIRAADPGVGALIDDFRAKNVARIKSLAGKELVEITEILNAAETPNLRVEVIRDQIRDRFDVSKSRASLLARDQVLTLNANVAKQRQINAGIEEYVWTTSGDDRVRDEHSERDGKRFRWDRPPEDGHPGEPIQCRCTAFPLLPELAPLRPGGPEPGEAKKAARLPSPREPSRRTVPETKPIEATPRAPRSRQLLRGTHTRATVRKTRVGWEVSVKTGFGKSSFLESDGTPTKAEALQRARDLIAKWDIEIQGQGRDRFER